jgi:glycosyltransferase involved in cell wall biosynthesis
MNILYVSDSTTVSGAEIVMLGYIDALRARGHDAFGFVSEQNPRLIAAFRERHVEHVATRSYSRRMIETTVNPAVLMRFAGSFHRASSEMVRYIKAARIDLIHSISYPACLYAALAAARTRRAHIWHEHNIKRLHRVNRIIYRQASRTCTFVVGPSDAVTDNLARAGIHRGRLRTVYNGIDLQRFSRRPVDHIERLRHDLGLSSGESAIGLFGQMLPYKGHRTLIAAAPEVLRAHPQSRFYFVGALENPPYEQELRDLISSNGLGARIHFTGWRNDVQDLVRAMDVVVVGTTTPEPAALMLMEAAAMERAVVATRTGGTPEILLDGETGLLFEPGDSSQLAEQVVRLLKDPELARKLGTAGRERVENQFSRERHLTEMFGLYGIGREGHRFAGESNAASLRRYSS